MLRFWKSILAKLPGAQQWRPDPTSGRLLMRRRRPDGEVEYREPTADEVQEAVTWQAHR